MLVTDRTRSQRQRADIRFLTDVAVLIFQDTMKSLESQEGAQSGLTHLLLGLGRSWLRWLCKSKSKALGLNSENIN